MGLRRFFAPVAVGVVVAVAFLGWGFVTRHSAVPDVVEGWARPNGNGTAIAFYESDDHRDSNSYIVAGASWAGRDGLWHDGADGPTCVGTDTSARVHVRLGVVDVEPDVEGGGPRVVWLRCLD
ncbi:hypothetical protein [Lentzea sp. NPDC003310]|uniref:hypothetical protein n=1 Tax=Lentzea sp. NPDC003310 TaxID=3154447 RepID=UPI0033BAA711